MIRDPRRAVRFALRWGVVAAGAIGVAWLALAALPQATRPDPPWNGGATAGARTGEGDRSAAGIHIALQRRDCPDAGRALDRLASRAANAGIPVHGVLLRDGIRAPADGDDLGLSFPVRPESGGWTRLLRSMGLQRSPAVLLVDGRGRLRRVVPWETAENRTGEILDHARELVEEEA